MTTAHTPVRSTLNYVAPLVRAQQLSLCARLPFVASAVETSDRLLRQMAARTDAVDHLDSLVSPYYDSASRWGAPYAEAYAEGVQHAQEQRADGRPYTILAALGLLQETVAETWRSDDEPHRDGGRR